ncbi:MAG TPA: tRNA (N6-isopentenyl adenosine(37)-C2)-methylthiotransferase MiaB, partial [Candidatus Limnocylindrales bacterium]
MTTRALPVIDAWPSAARPAIPQVDGPLAEFATEDVALPTFHVWTLGCQMNRSDSEEMAGALLAAGCAEAPSLETADLVVINSCAIREAAEQKVIGRMGHLGRLKQANPALRVVLTGCSVRDNNRGVLKRRYPAVDLFLTPDEEPELTARLGLAGATAPGALAGQGALRAAGLAPQRGSTISAWLPIIYGCDKTCTYCIVPFSRGAERSRPFDEVLAEAHALAAAGYREVTLLGQNVNSYGHDLPAEPRFADVRRTRELGRRLDLDGKPDIAALLRAIDGLRTADGVPAIPRLRFVTSHPWDLGDRLIGAMAESPSVCEHLHLPVQSGDDAVLRRMGRQYTVEAYLRLVERLRSAVPGIVLTTDVIVGFCGESEAQFERTLELLREVRFEQVFVAAFSVRPGTPAARLVDDVPRADKKRRLQELLDVQEEIGLAANRAWVGRTTEVLVDQLRPTASHGDHATDQPEARVAGRNRQNKLVHLPGGSELL